jgi:TIR domain-containing protein
MKGFFFIAYDIQDARAKRCASWIADCLGDHAVMPQHSWALGYWMQYLEHVVRKAERIIVVLTPGFLTTAEPFVQYQRTLVQQEPFASAQQQDAVSRLLVVLAGDCAVHLHEESVFYRVQDWVDFRSVLNTEEACQQLLLDALRPDQALVRIASIT